MNYSKPQKKVSLQPRATAECLDFIEEKEQKRLCGDGTLTGSTERYQKTKSSYVRNPTQQCVLDEQQKARVENGGLCVGASAVVLEVLFIDV